MAGLHTYGVQVRHASVPAKADAFGTRIIKDVFSDKLRYTISSSGRVSRGPVVLLKLALLYSPLDGVISQSSPHFALAFYWGPQTSPLMFRGFTVTSEAAASGQWKEGFDPQSGRWDEAETTQFPLSENRYVGLRFRKGLVGDWKHQESWYLFVSILNGE